MRLGALGSCAGPSDFLKNSNPKFNDSEFQGGTGPGEALVWASRCAGSPQASVPRGAVGCWDQAGSLPLSAGAVRASSVFPILSVTLLFFGGLCVAASEFHRSRHNVILSAGIFFVSAGEHRPRPDICTDPTPSQGQGQAMLLRVPPKEKQESASSYYVRKEDHGLSPEQRCNTLKGWCGGRREATVARSAQGGQD